MSEAPAWFTGALADSPAAGQVEVQGCRVRYLEWGERGRPGVVMVHGGAAHARWWTFLAPFFAGQYHVVALDLSGHGDSGRRDDYRMETWAEEVLAVAQSVEMDRPPILVGHSMGGVVAITAASTMGERLAGAVIIDAPIRRPNPEAEAAQRGRDFKVPGTYPTLAEALRHFHLVPPQPVTHPWIVDYIARNSLHETEAGWTWKFDPRIFTRAFPAELFRSYLADVRCRVAVFHGELSHLVTPDVSAYMSELLHRNAPFVEIPQAYHHLILDQPLAFVAALRALLADWEHSVPRRRD